jgi:hypothetical protein
MGTAKTGLQRTRRNGEERRGLHTFVVLREQSDRRTCTSPPFAKCRSFPSLRSRAGAVLRTTMKSLCSPPCSSLFLYFLCGPVLAVADVVGEGARLRSESGEEPRVVTEALSEILQQAARAALMRSASVATDVAETVAQAAYLSASLQMLAVGYSAPPV